RRALDLDHLSYQRRQVGDRPALLASEDADDRLLLVLPRPIVDIEMRPPIPLQRVPGNEYVDRKRQAGNVYPIDRATVEAVREARLTRPVIWFFAHQARAKNVAVADFENAAFELVRHRSPPLVRARSYGAAIVPSTRTSSKPSRPPIVFHSAMARCGGKCGSVRPP